MHEQIIGIVESGAFRPLWPNVGEPAKLTSISMNMGVPPESSELELGHYSEGTALLIAGHGGGDWIYSAQVIEAGGPLISAVVKKVFGQS